MNTKSYYRKPHSGFAWLELLLALSTVVLVVQFFPSLWLEAHWALDVRNWSRTFWFASNLLFAFVLIAIRFAPDLYQDWRERNNCQVAEKENKQKQLEIKQQREVLRRINQSRKRRIY